MFRSADRAKHLAFVAAALMPLAGSTFDGIGRAATAAEIKAWDIDVRPDFTGLPDGRGTVAEGELLWEAKCTSCHGSFGESNAVFTPLAGGVTRQDLETGRSATLASDAPTRTALSVTPTVSTLWDYINRAMPWNAPLSLSADEVYAVLAYLLNLGDIVPADFTLDQHTIREVQQRMPNRNGLALFPGMWDRRGKPDIQAVACMSNCRADATITSSLPEHARNSHGNLALQTREWGPTRGANTELPAATSAKEVADAAAAPPRPAAKPLSTGAANRKLAEGRGCLACHGLAAKLVGPGFSEVAERYKGDAAAQAKLEAKVKAGGGGIWGGIAMPGQALPDQDIKALVQWILAGAKSN